MGIGMSGNGAGGTTGDAGSASFTGVFTLGGLPTMAGATATELPSFAPASFVAQAGDGDIRATVTELPTLCAPGATVIWTRGTFAPDLTPTIRRWFGHAGFTELRFTAIPGTTVGVGAHVLRAEPRPYEPDVRLFTFLPRAERPSQRGIVL